MKPLFAAKHDADRDNLLLAIKSLDEDLIYVHGSICRSLESMQTGERGTVWDDLQDLISDADEPAANLAAILPRLKDIAAKGKETAQAQRDTLDLIDRKVKLRQAQAKIEADAGETITKKEMAQVLGQIIMVFKQAVETAADPATAQAILTMTQRDLSTVLYGHAKPSPAMPTAPHTVPEESGGFEP